MPQTSYQLKIDDPRMDIPITEYASETHVRHRDSLGLWRPGVHPDKNGPTCLDHHAFIIKTDQWTYATIERALRKIGKTSHLFFIAGPRGPESFTGYVEKHGKSTLKIRATSAILPMIPKE